MTEHHAVQAARPARAESMWNDPPVPADTPTILATSGGLRSDPRTIVRPAALMDYASAN